jgi:putative ABC transport system permease protein
VLTTAVPDIINYANLKTIRIDTTVWIFTLGVSVATGILFGLAPALKAVQTDVQMSLRDASRSVAGGNSLTRSALVVAEVALSMILLIGAGLLVRSFARLSSVNPGFDASHVLSLQILENGRFRNNDQGLLDFNMQMLERVRAVPGVEAAGTSHFLPLGRIIPGTGFWRFDRPVPNHGEQPVTEVLCLLPGYFAAMSIPIARGRVFDERDRKGSPYVVVINQTLANQFYPQEDPIGKPLAIQWGRDQPYQVIGVVGDVRQNSLAKDPNPALFLPTLQQPTTPVYLVARAHGDPKQLIKAIESQIRALDRDMPIADVRTMDEYVSDSVAAPRFNTILLGSFAVLALILAAVGIFGVISYSVAQRTRELGIRRALGAGTASVMALVLGQGMSLTAIGVAIGIAGAFALARLLQSLLFGIESTDPITYAAVAAILSAVAFIASYLPARRAAKVDPMVALRHE